MRSFYLGRAFGIPLYIHWSFLLLPLWALFLFRDAGLVGIAFGQAFLLSMFGCVLLHELGHALMARYFRIATRDITLYPIGGVARLESMGHAPHQEVAIALAGPAVNLGIVFLLSPFVAFVLFSGLIQPSMLDLSRGTPSALSFLLNYLFALWVGNGFLLLFNLIPAFPMDGGRVLRALLSTGVGHLRATEIAATVGLFLAGGLGLVGIFTFNFTLALVSVFVAFAGQAELSALRRFEAQKLAMNTIIEEISVPRPVEAPIEMPALNRFTGLLWDRENRVWVYWVNGRPVDAL